MMGAIESFLQGGERFISEPRFGRNLRDGYVRGTGLAYGHLVQNIRAESDYQEAVQLAGGRSICWEPRLMNLYLLIRFYLPKLSPGDIVEFGSYRGGSAIFMAALAKRYLPHTRVWGLDTFEGMPDTDLGVDLHVRGNFNDVDFDALTAATAADLPNLTFVKGLFEETTEGVLAKAQKLVLAHIDCDIQSAVIYTWNRVKPRMVTGGYVVFDDATEASCLGATEAVEREVIHKEGICSEQIYPHYVFRYPPLA
jgi:hypothetical protein